MSSSVTHRVFRCILEVQGAPRSEVEFWRSHARRLWSEALADTFERHCDRLAPNGERLRLGRLEVEFTAADGDSEPELRERFAQALQARLAQARPAASRNAKPQTVPGTPAHERDRDWLGVWLLTGTIPWWADKPNAASLFEAFRERLRRPDGEDWLRGVLRQHPPAIRRLALQWNVNQHAQVMAVLGSRGWPDAASLLAAVTRTQESGASNERDHAALVEAVWRLWATGRAPSAALETLTEQAIRVTNPRTLDAVRSVLERETLATAGPDKRTAEVGSGTSPNTDEPRQIVERLWSQLPHPSASARQLATLARQSHDPNVLRQWHDKVREELAAEKVRADASAKAGSKGHDARTPKTDLHRAISGEASASEMQAESESSTPVAGAPHGIALSQVAEPLPHPSMRRHVDGQPTAVQGLLTPGLPVVSAGLVLIAPYLPRFLATIGLLPTSPAESSEPGASRLPLLLHWLATGSDEAVEHELVLPKVLAGIALDEPVVCRHAFPEATLAEANRMLASVIEHWTVLKETSIPGLRESFLQRGGLLREDGTQWLLRVEHRAWDVLLDRVPWTFRTLRLPWMERPLMVEWEAYV